MLCCFCLSRTARTRSPISPLSRLPTPPASLPGAARAPSRAAGSPSSVGRWQPRFRPQVGFRASKSEVWEEAPAGSTSGARAGLAVGNLLLPGSVGGAGERRCQLREQPAVVLPQSLGLFQECHQHSKQADPPSFPSRPPNLARLSTQEP